MRNHLVRSAAVAALVFTVYFVAGSFISGNLRFPYGYISLGAILLFTWAGYQLGHDGSVLKPALATTLAALLATVASWMLLSLLDPNAPRARTEAIAEVLAVVGLAAFLLAAAGAGAKKLKTVNGER